MSQVDELAGFKEVCERAARAGGDVLRHWQGRVHAREKGPADLVTEADLASQEAVRATLLEVFPEHGFLGEENLSIPASADGYRWIVDPLDGTTNYIHGIPVYAVSIALERRGEVIVGTIYDPSAEACFTGVRGRGATLNGQPLKVSAAEYLAEAVVSMSLPARVRRESPELDQFLKVVVRAQSIRRLGSAALALASVAAGRFDAYWSTCTKAWDIAAGILLIEEAGGIVTALDGGPVQLEVGSFVAAANPRLHAELLGVLDADAAAT